jgi:hypothetical protein
MRIRAKDLGRYAHIGERTAVDHAEHVS